MEILNTRRRKFLAINALFATALSGCTIESYSTDPSNVQCDGTRTKTDLSNDGTATFVVHGTEKGDVAFVKVRRTGNEASISVTGDLSGPPQRLEDDGFTEPTQIVDGPELTAYGAGGAWLIDVQKDSIVIQGSCDGL